MNPFDQFDAPAEANFFDQFDDKPKKRKPVDRNAFAVINDTGITLANTVAGGVGAIADFVSPGNAFSQYIDKNIKEGEQSQSDAKKADREQRDIDLARANGFAEEAKVAAAYAANNPLESAAQVVGSFVLPGGAIKAAGAGAKALGAGAKVAQRVALGGGAAAGAALAGGDAAGTAYELSKKGGATEEQAVEAARQASVIPAVIGGAGALVGAERLVAGAKGFTGNLASRALKTGAVEALQEGVEEGVTQYEGQRAAVPYNPGLDPMKGVGAAATTGAILGAATGGGMSALHGDAQPVNVAAPVVQTPQAAAPEQVAAAPVAPPPSERPQQAAPAMVEARLAELEITASQRDLTPAERTEAQQLIQTLEAENVSAPDAPAAVAGDGGQQQGVEPSPGVGVARPGADNAVGATAESAPGVGPVDAAPASIRDGGAEQVADLTAKTQNIDTSAEPVQTQADFERVAPQANPGQSTPANQINPGELTPANQLPPVPISVDATGKPASWVIKEKESGRVVLETFDEAKVARLNTAKYEAIPIAKHLASLRASSPVGPLQGSGVEVIGSDPRLAYGPPDFAQTLAASPSEDVRTLGSALESAAPRWSQMRGAVAAGRVDAAYDLTPDLMQAVDVVRQSREARTSLYDAATKLSPDARALVGVMYGGKYMTIPRGRQQVEAVLGDYSDAVLSLASDGQASMSVTPAEIAAALTTENVSNEQQPTTRPAVRQAGNPGSAPAQASQVQQRPRDERPGDGATAGSRVQPPARPDQGGQQARTGDQEAAKGDEAAGLTKQSQPKPEAPPKPSKDAAGESTQVAATEARTKFSRQPTSADEQALSYISQQSDVFSLPKSKAKDLERIIAENMPGLTFKKSKFGDLTIYKFTLPDGTPADMSVRPPNPYGPVLYGWDKGPDGEMTNIITERPGENAEAMDGKTDVWIDVSRLKSGELGQAIYNIAATYAHNNGMVFIGDPNGLSDIALRRRTENMLNSALKFGTTEHLGPHPMQTDGSKAQGVPPLRWVYGDHVGNIERMIDVSIKSAENAGYVQPAADYIPASEASPRSSERGRFIDGDGLDVGPGAFDTAAQFSGSRAAQAGGRTLARMAVFESLLQRAGESRAETWGARGRGGILAEFGKIVREFAVAQKDARIFYSRGDSSSGLTTDAAQAAVDSISSKWANAPEIVVVSDMQDSRVPEQARKDNAAQKSQNAEGDPEAFYLGGKVYVVAGALKSEADVARVVFHEVLGHAGLRGAFGDALNPILIQIAAVRGAEVQAKAKQYGIDAATKEGRLEAAEEVLAEMAQTQPELGFVRRAVAAIRSWLRANVPGFAKLKLTDDEIVRDYLLPARGFVERGRVAKKTAGETAFSRSKDTIEVDGVERPRANSKGQPIHPTEDGIRNFWRWFKDSKAVDAEGRPLVVYHGTAKDFEAFDNAKTASNDMGLWGRGHYFASSPESASSYALRQGDDARVIPAYVSIQSPLELSTGKDLVTRLPDGTNTRELIGQNLDGAKIKAIAIKGGHDGVIQIKPDSLIGDVVAFRPEQIKSATGNQGSYDPANADIRFSRSTMGDTTPPPVPPKQQTRAQKLKAKALQLASPETIDGLIYQFQDKFIDLKRVQAHIKALGGVVTDLNDAYLGEELYHKRVAKRTEDFLATELKPLLAEMRAKAVKHTELEQFLHARHAPEANKAMAERNPAAEFKGTEAERLSLSGMSDAEAKAIMDGLTPEKRKALDSLAARVDAINAKTMAELEKYGLMDKASLDAWRKAYEFYVPLHRDEAHPDSATHPVGQGFSVKGDASKRRVGSNQKVTHILGHVAMQREAALTRGEKNNVAKKLYLLASQNPDPNLWAVDKVPKIKTVGDDGTVRDMSDPMFKMRPNVVVVRIAGKDAAIVFNERDPQALRMAEAIKNQDATELGWLLTQAAKVTRYFSMINTQLNPIFGVVNFIRDVQGAALNLSSTPLAGKQAQVAKHLFPALRAVYRQERGKGAANAQNAEYIRLWNDLQDTGGATGYRALYQTAEDRVKALEAELKKDDASAARKVFDATLDWLSDYNEAMENSTRVAVYKVALEQGMTKERAASVAKNITVNFNRKGRMGSQIGAGYAFFNAAVQGTTRLAQTMTGPAGRKIIGGGLAVGMLNTLMGMAVMGAGDGEDDDEWAKIPDFVKERNLIIPTGKQDYVTIPMPLGFHALPNLGRLATELALMSDKTAGKQAGKALGAMLDAFNPLGGGGDPGQTIMPTVLDPAWALATNKDWTGKPIFREDMNKLDPTPGHTRAKESASAFSKFVAEKVNAATGGNEYRHGAVSWTPDQIDYIVGQLTGGLGREAMKLEQSITSTMTGDELPSYKVPLLGRLYGNTRGPANQSAAFYDNAKELNEIENEIQGRAKAGEDIGEFMEREPLSKLVGAGNAAERQIAALRKQRRLVIQQGGDDSKAQAEEINAQIGAVMGGLNREMAKVRREAGQ